MEVGTFATVVGAAAGVVGAILVGLQIRQQRRHSTPERASSRLLPTSPEVVPVRDDDPPEPEYADPESQRRFQLTAVRRQVLQQVDAALERRQGTVLLDLGGVYGMGKTILMTHIYIHLKQKRSVRVAWAQLDAPGRGVTSLRESFYDYCRCLKALAPRLLDRRERARLWAAIAQSERAVASADPPMSDAEVEHAQEQIRHAMVPALRRVARSQRLVVLLDDYQHARGRHLDEWLRTIAWEVSMLVVITRGGRPDPIDPNRPSISQRQLDRLNRNEVAAYLAAVVGPNAATKDIVDIVYGFGEGWPLATVVAASVIEQRGAEATNSILAATDYDNKQRLAEVIVDLMQALGGARMEAAFEAACILRRFNERSLLAIMDPEHRAGSPLIPQLQKLAFVDHVGYGDSDHWWIHQFIRQQEEEERMDQQRRDELHRRARDHYRNWLFDLERSSGGNSYERALRYESLEWQRHVRELLYHQARLPEADDVGLELTSLYMDVFHWWRWYLPYVFSDQVLTDLESVATGDHGRAWLAALQQFDRNYPPQHSGREPNWAEVQNSLNQIRLLGQLDGDVEKFDPASSRRHLRAMVDILQAWLYSREEEVRRDRHETFVDRGTEALMEGAMRLLTAEADRWIHPYIKHQVGLLHLGRGEHKAAAQCCDDGFALALSDSTDDRQVDHEVLANLHQLRAEILKRSGDREAAIQECERMVIDAYAFHAFPTGPDEYTQAFYGDVCSAYVRELRALRRDAGVGPARDAASRLRHLWAHDGEESSIGESHLSSGPGQDARLAAFLFPRGPNADELQGNSRMHYRAAVADALQLIRKRAGPHAALPA